MCDDCRRSNVGNSSSSNNSSSSSSNNNNSTMSGQVMTLKHMG